MPEKIVIYGARNIGKQFFLKIKEVSEVVCFVDKNKKGEAIDRVKIVGLEMVEYNKKVPFIVTATYDFENMCREIRRYDSNAIIISLNDIINE